MWWSSSTFVTTAISGRSALDRAVGLVALDDEPPLARAARSRRAAAPRRRRARPGRARARRGTNAIIAVVVVFPCAPATTIDAPQRDELGEELRARRARRPAGDTRVETTASQPVAARPARARSRPRSPLERARGTASRRGPSRRPRRPTRARGRRSAESPAPPIPTNQSRLPVERLQARSAPRRSRRPRRGRASAQHRLAHRAPAARGRRAARRRAPGTRSSSASGTTTAPPPRSKWRAFSVWWSAVACGYGTRIAGVPAAASSQTGPARARDHEVGRGERGAELVGRREQHVVVARARAARSALEVALAARGAAPPGPRRRSARPRARSGSARPASAPKTSSTGPSAGRPKRAPRPRPARRRGARAGIGRPVTRYFGAVAAGDRVGEEDAPRERRGEPVREPEVRVRLGQRRRDPPPPGRETIGPAT